jgi:hypothetical protein
MSLFLSQDEVQEYEKQFKYFISEAVNDIAEKVEKRLIEKMLTVDNTPVEFKVEKKGGPTCPNSKAGGEHFVINILHTDNGNTYQYLCRCGAPYSGNHNSQFSCILKDSIVGVPECILWAAFYEGNLFKLPDYPRPCGNGGGGKMKDWVEMMKERHWVQEYSISKAIGKNGEGKRASFGEFGLCQ